MTSPAQNAKLFWEAGLRVFGLHGADENGKCACGWDGCRAAYKHPLTSNWQHTPRWSEEQIDAMEASGQFATGFGVLCAGLLVVDVDARNGGVDSYTRLLEAVPEAASAGMIVETGSGSRHLYFRAPADVALLQHHGDYQGLDFKSSGYVVGPGSRHASGNRYRLVYGSPDDIDDAPAGLIDLLRQPEKHRAECDWRTFDASRADIIDMLGHVDNAGDGQDYGTWIAVGMAIHHATGGAGFQLWDDWSRLANKYDANTTARKWGSFGEAANPVTLGTLIYHARQGGWQKSRSYEELLEAARALDEASDLADVDEILAEAADLFPTRQEAVLRAIKKATKIPMKALRAQMLECVEQDEGTARPTDDLDLARITVDVIGAENVLCAGPIVYRWDRSGVWTQLEDRAIKQSVQNVIDQYNSFECDARLVNSVTDLFKNEIYRSGHEFNLGDPETVNCTNGELVLQDGRWKLQPHCREHYRTTQIPVAYDPKADAPLFRAFLSQIFHDDPDAADKIKAVLELIGYTLMSHARHERFIMLIGPGANGKSVLLAILESLCGTVNVAGVQPANFDRSFQRAHLHQKLANIVTELRQGEVIADAELKAITSGEPASVEHKFKDPFMMRPFATCWFGTNHMPHTRDFSEALFRRATILTFNRVFEPHEQDRRLKDKLLADLPGILNMALDAYATALVEGFAQPQSSEDAKKEWRLEADQVALFVEDACERDPMARTAAGDVYQAYRDWAAENGIAKTMSQKGLRDRLSRLGFGTDRDRRTRYVTGLTVTTAGWEGW